MSRPPSPALGTEPLTLEADGRGVPPRVGGFTEVTAFVSDLADWTGALPAALGWAVVRRGAVARARLAFWGVPTTATGEEVVLGPPGADRGQLRLVQVSGVALRRCRPEVAPWHTGGLFDANARVRDIAAVYDALCALGWRGLTSPTRFVFGPFTVQEVLMEGPDGVVLAFIEREAPPLTGWPDLDVASRLFNSTQTVRSLDRALDFYVGVLGWKTYLTHEGPSPPPGANVLGLDAETAQRVTRRVRIVHPHAENDGSVELIEFVDHAGEDFGDADLPGLGLAALTFPCVDARALDAHLRAHGIVPIAGPVYLPHADGRPVLHLAVTTPDGAHLHFVGSPDADAS